MAKRKRAKEENSQRQNKSMIIIELPPDIWFEIANRCISVNNWLRVSKLFNSIAKRVKLNVMIEKITKSSHEEGQSGKKWMYLSSGLFFIQCFF